MSAELESFMSNRFNQLKTVIEQIKEIGTKINEVAHDDNVTISYTVPMNKTLECKASLKEVMEEQPLWIFDHAVKCKVKELTPLLNEMVEVLDQV